MSNTFSSRGKGFEAKLQQDSELRFKAESRRNKLLGLWLAEKMGLSGAQAEAYAKEVVLSDLDVPGIDDMVAKIMGDVRARGLALDEADIRREAESLMARATDEVAAR